jgi:Cu+-exporting ATPase
MQIRLGDNFFCCDGCRLVYDLLNNNDLCTYYDLNKNPGQTMRRNVRKEKFAYLDDHEIEKKLLIYEDDEQRHLVLYIPAIHCSSCLYLLEHMNKIEKGVIKTEVNFPKKELKIVYDPRETSLRSIAETLTSIGYEPYLSLNYLKGEKPKIDKRLIYKLGIAGFCFGNIMLIAFAEYLGLQETEKNLQLVFRWVSLILSLPVVFYSATVFYETAWGGLKNKFVNIDAPIVLAILVTFFRSIYEVLADVGSGYFDSLSGIVFFMLIGRILQEKTHQKLAFDRDYSSYFPIAVSILEKLGIVYKQLPDIKVGDVMLIHNEELIPADGLLTKGKAWIDYSFVTGESNPVTREIGEMVYAGGKQLGGNIELLTVKEVSQSYLTELWDNEKNRKNKIVEEHPFVDAISRYFSIILFSIAIATGLYRYFNHLPIWQPVTAILIIACPCALLLSNTFTNGHILRILSKNGFFLKNAGIIEDVAKIDYIVFDKTGTLTSNQFREVTYEGEPLTEEQQKMVYSLASQSTHPLSRAIVDQPGLQIGNRVLGFKEHPGLGIEGFCNDTLISLGSPRFIRNAMVKPSNAPQVHLAIENKYYGVFTINNHLREGITNAVNSLKSNYGLSVISGDNNNEESRIRKVFGYDIPLFFNQKPHDKVKQIQHLQASGKKVMMIGDGLNDSSALLRSTVGVALTESTNNFTPASDAILDATFFYKLPQLIKLCKANKTIIMTSFVMSIMYNLVGLYFAVSGQLSPLVAAILMPLSSISIMILTFGGSVFTGKRLKLAS